MEFKARPPKFSFESKLPRGAHGDLKLQASEAASTYRPPPFTLALDGMTVTRNARQRVEVLGTRESLRDPVCILSQHVLQFGKYRGQTFKWVLENDLGWVTGVMALVDLDNKETEALLSRNKFRLLISRGSRRCALTLYVKCGSSPRSQSFSTPSLPPWTGEC